MNVETQSFIQQVKDSVAEAEKLRKQAEELAKQAKEAEKRYEDYKNHVLLAHMINAGLQSVTDDNGTEIKLVTKYYCTPNKNLEDRMALLDWLRSLGGESLIQSKAEVDGAQVTKLIDSGIPFVDKMDVNTASLKAFIISLLGAKGGVAQITEQDIPDYVHFSTVQDVVIG